MENISLLDTLVILYNGKLVYKGVPENALKSFYANEFKEIYSRLQEHSTDYWQEKFLESAQ
jgi:ABC-type multidrug transport system ATPase subunit